VVRLRELIVASGALAEAEAKIESLFREARAAAEGLPVDAGLVCELLAVTERLAWRRF
jgi:hypothetical protein